MVEEHPLQVLVWDSTVGQTLKRKMQRDGILRELKERSVFAKLSTWRVRDAADPGGQLIFKRAGREGMVLTPEARLGQPSRISGVDTAFRPSGQDTPS